MIRKVNVAGRFNLENFFFWSLSTSLLDHFMKRKDILFFYCLCFHLYYSLRTYMFHHFLPPMCHILCLWLIFILPFDFSSFIGLFRVEIFMSLTHSKLLLVDIDILRKNINKMRNSFSHRHLILNICLFILILLLIGLRLFWRQQLLDFVFNHFYFSNRGTGLRNWFKRTWMWHR